VAGEKSCAVLPGGRPRQPHARSLLRQRVDDQLSRDGGNRLLARRIDVGDRDGIGGGKGGGELGGEMPRA
jgi:hypothetical protein